MADTKNVRMKEHYTPQTGPRRGKTLFLGQVYELDAVTAKEVVDAGAGGQTQKEVTVAAPASVVEVAEAQSKSDKKGS